jgi:hypothetical protein
VVVCCAASVPNLDMVESVDDEKVMTFFFYEHLHLLIYEALLEDLSNYSSLLVYMFVYEFMKA